MIQADISLELFGGACRLLENWVDLRLWSLLSFFEAFKLTPGVSMAFLRHMWVRSKRMVGSSMWRQISSTSSDGIIQVKKYTKPNNLKLHRDGRRTLVKGKPLHFFLSKIICRVNPFRCIWRSRRRVRELDVMIHVVHEICHVLLLPEL